MTVHFGILGPLEARRSDTPIDLGPPKQKAVLAALLISANKVVSLDRLTEMLWGAEMPARAHGSIQAYIHNLRKVLEPGRAVRSQAQILVTQPPGYVLQVEPNALDASKFEMLAARGHHLLAQAHPTTAKEQFTQALALWRGPALAEFAFEQFAQPEAARLEQVRATVNEDLLEAELALGNHAAMIGDITVAVGEHPLRERLWSLLMLALYRSGRQGEALRAYAMARHTLAEELGIDPSPSLRALEAAILAQSPELEYYRPEPWTTESAVLDDASTRVVAPVRTSPPLVGREKQLRRLMANMSQAQHGHGSVVLISGEAGIGKTRLAEEVATEAGANDHLVAWGRAYERDGAPECWLWMQVAADLARRADPSRVRQALAGRTRELRPLLAELGAALELPEDRSPTPFTATPVSSGPETSATETEQAPSAVSIPRAEPAAAVVPAGQASVGPTSEWLAESASARFNFFEAMTGFLIDMADTNLLVVILEDLQWADRLSLELLEHVATRLHSGHVLFVVTSRPPENYLEMPLTDVVGALVRLPAFEWIELDGLTCPEVGRLIAQTGAGINSAQVSEIHARTDGNPFFVSNFARLLATREVPRPHLAGLIPSSVRAAIRRRLSRLPEQTYELLVVAAAMGRDFDIRKVAAASRTNLDDAVNWLQPAVVLGVVTEDMLSPGNYRFFHSLVQDTLRGEIAGLRRSTLRDLANRPGSERDDSTGSPADHPQEACG